MNFMKFPKAFLLDLDGTVLDTESLYLQLMMNYNKKYGLHISKQFYINNFLGKSRDVISEIMKIRWKDKYDENEYWMGLLKYRKDYLKNNKVKAKEGFLEFIKYVKLNHSYIGIVTSNSLDLVKFLLQQANINENDFDIIICRDNVEKIKPYSDLYEFAIKKLRIKKEDIIVIEDSPIGIEAAINANLKIINIKDIAFVNKDLNQKCCMTINSFYDIINFMKMLEVNMEIIKSKKKQRTF